MLLAFDVLPGKMGPDSAGQLVTLDPCYVLVDGYLRVEVVKRNGMDIVLAEVW